MDQTDYTEPVDIDLFEAGGEEGSGFHISNVAADHYHRSEALERTGAIDIQCSLERVFHGTMSTGSDRKYASLIVMKWSFKRQRKRSRISEATIVLTFGPGGPDGGDIEVEKISFDDFYSLMSTTHQETTTVGLEGTMGASFGMTTSLGGKWEKSSTIERRDAITLSGGKHVLNNRPPNRQAKWTLLEKETQPTGIPTSLTTAVLVSRPDKEMFLCDINFSCKTDLKTAVSSIFKTIPDNDPIIFQPNPEKPGTRPNQNVVYDVEEDLGAKDLGEFCDVTYSVEIARK